MQTFTAPVETNYKIECWGASGGNAVVGYGGGGGYVSGEISLTKDRTLYVYIGQKGNGSNQYSSTYMFNGGGYANKNDTQCGSCGGGATDIRTINGDWDNSTSLNSRIMIAAGGGGIRSNGAVYSSCAGGLEGYDGILLDFESDHNKYQGKGATQTEGGAAPTKWGNAENGTAGELGKGGIGGYNITDQSGGGSGGGGGLYGGSGSSGAHSTTWSGGGGSSYISGHPGCTAQALTFSNTIMIDGAGYQWTSTKGAQVGIPTTANQSIRENGYVGDGYCIITWTPIL